MSSTTTRREHRGKLQDFLAWCVVLVYCKWRRPLNKKHTDLACFLKPSCVDEFVWIFSLHTFLLLCNNLLNNSCLIFPAAHKKSILAGWQKIALFYYTKMTQVTSWQHFLRHDLFSEIWKNLPWNFLLLYLSLSTPASCLSWCCCVQNPLGAFLKPIVRFGKGFCSSAAAISEALFSASSRC